jgi:hypothetical protein
MFIVNVCLNMFRATLCPSSGEQRPCYCPATATNHIQQNQNNTPNAANRAFVLLKMGIMMPETC